MPGRTCRRLRRSCAFPPAPVATARFPNRFSLKSPGIRRLHEPGTGTPPVREHRLFLLHRSAAQQAPRPSRPPPLIAKKNVPWVGAALAAQRCRPHRAGREQVGSDLSTDPAAGYVAVARLLPAAVASGAATAAIGNRWTARRPPTTPAAGPRRRCRDHAPASTGKPAPVAR